MENKTKLTQISKHLFGFGVLLLPQYVLSEAPASISDDVNQISYLEEIIVTGTHIKNDTGTSLVPVSAFDKNDIEIFSNNQIAETLSYLPSTGVPDVSQSTSNFNINSTGVASVDLRNLGSTRTLVLINGRRHVGGDNDFPNVVDLNAIPSSLIERVEVITGGASAVYGSEAVAGVVNIITKKSFDGIELKMDSGQSAKEDGLEKNISLTGGRSFSEGKGQALFNLSWYDQEPIFSRDRTFSAYDDYLGNFTAFSSYIPGSAVVANGTLLTQSSNGLWSTPYDNAEMGYNRNSERHLKVPFTRRSANFNLDFELSENSDFFLETSFVETNSVSSLEPAAVGQFLYLGSEELIMPSSNPLIPGEILAAWSGEAGEEIPQTIAFRRRLSELGNRRSHQDRDTTRLAVGLTTEFGDHYGEVYYQWGQTRRNKLHEGEYNKLNVLYALDAVNEGGSLVCRDALARSLGCEPLDVFGLGSISEEALSFISHTSQDGSTIEQQVLSATIGGELVKMTESRSLEYALGLQWRDEFLKTTADALSSMGLSSENTIIPLEGEYEVTEAFVELNVPLLEKKFVSEYLGASLAYRAADYSETGSASSWKVGLEWQPLKELSIRGVVAESVRAPNVSELFLEGIESFFSYVDPCTGGGQSGIGNTQENCESEGITSDFVPDASQLYASGMWSGNRNLTEEVAETLTLGFVLKPSAFPGLSISVDYFDIEIKDAIETIEPVDKITQCYASSNFPNDPFCSGISRAGSEANFAISQLDVALENIGAIRTNGVDVAVQYQTNLFGGQFDWYTMYTKTHGWRSHVFDTITTDLNEPGYQKRKAFNRVSFAKQGWQVAVTSRFMGSGIIDETFTPDFWEDNTLHSVWYHDIYASFLMSMSDVSYDLFFGVDNVFDEKPQYIPSQSIHAYPGTGTAAGVFDVAGLHYRLGIKAKW